MVGRNERGNPTRAKSLAPTDVSHPRTANPIPTQPPRYSSRTLGADAARTKSSRERPDPVDLVSGIDDLIKSSDRRTLMTSDEIPRRRNPKLAGGAQLAPKRAGRKKGRKIHTPAVNPCPANAPQSKQYPFCLCEANSWCIVATPLVSVNPPMTNGATSAMPATIAEPTLIEFQQAIARLTMEIQATRAAQEGLRHLFMKRWSEPDEFGHVPEGPRSSTLSNLHIGMYGQDGLGVLTKGESISAKDDVMDQIRIDPENQDMDVDRPVDESGEVAMRDPAGGFSPKVGEDMSDKICNGGFPQFGCDLVNP